MALDIAPPGSLPPDLFKWVEQSLGTPVGRATLQSGGNRHGTWRLRLVAPVAAAGGDEVYLRVGAAEDEDGLTPLAREAAAYHALENADLPVPRLLASSLGANVDLILVTRMPGSPTLPPPGPRRDGVTTDLMRRLAALHALEPDALALDPLGPAGTRRELVLAELERWERRYRASGRLDPLIECGLAWCVRGLPADDRPAVLVHGDVGPGNFLHDGQRVTGLVDWELSHLGDPLDDLAGFSLRTVHARLDGFAELVVAYGEAAGETVDPERLAYHQVLAALRVTILRHVAPAVQADVRQANRMISRTLHRRLLVEAMHVAAGRPRPLPVTAPIDRTPQTELFEAAAELLRHTVLSHCDEAGAEATKTVARLVKHLGEVDRLGATAEAALREALPAGMVTDVDDQPIDYLHVEVATRLRDRSIDPLDILSWLATVEGWETALLRPAMGALADRPLPTAHGVHE